jgi:hypothetical protein
MPVGATAFVSVVCLVVLLFMRRTWQVYKFRIGLMRSDLDTYLRLPFYNEMVLKFWKPLSSFLANIGGQPVEQLMPGDSEETGETIVPSEEERKDPVD